jgi:hypothetical protein
MPRRASRGFGLTQLVLAVTVLLALAFVLPASLAVRLNRARVARAARDVHAIADAMARFHREHGYLPGRAGGAGQSGGLLADRVAVLVGPGEIPRISEDAAAQWESSRPVLLDDELIGMRAPVDPWGFRYTLGVGSSEAWVLCAGPNGIIDTPLQPAARALGGDDIGVAFR